MFKDMKISVKISLAFSVIISLFILSAALSYKNIKDVRQATMLLEKSAIPSLVKTLDIKYTVSSARRLEGQLLAADIAERESLNKRTAEIRANIDKKVTELRDLIGGDPKDPNTIAYRNLVETLSVDAKEYSDINKQMFELVLSDRIGDARELMFAKGRDVYARLIKKVEELEESNKKYAAYQSSVVDDKSNRLTNTLIVSIVLTVLVSSAMVYLIVKMMKTAMGNVTTIAEKISNGDLTSNIPEPSKNEIGLVYASLQKMQDNLYKLVTDVRSSAESVSNASNEIASGNQDLSARTESQASALQETASSAEELSSTVAQNASNARQANGLASKSSHVVMRGASIVTELVGSMGKINDSSKEIEKIISVIDGIAFQTNILALNAAVEAARAGDHGKGFAVVASEVRTLAGRSAEAAKEIKLLINESVDRVLVGTDQADKAGKTMLEVMNSIKEVTDLLANIDTASQEQANGVSQVGQAINQMDQATQQNAALVEEMAAAASGLSSQAKDLVHLVDYFKLRN